jgi:hypothetical protein
VRLGDVARTSAPLAIRGPAGQPGLDSAGSASPVALESQRHPNYRLLWFGTVISSYGDWMDEITPAARTPNTVTPDRKSVTRRRKSVTRHGKGVMPAPLERHASAARGVT